MAKEICTLEEIKFCVNFPIRITRGGPDPSYLIVGYDLWAAMNGKICFARDKEIDDTQLSRKVIVTLSYRCFAATKCKCN